MITADALVLGRGIVGSACANLLAQAGLKTIVLAPPPAQYPMATINNQGWLQSGACLVFDPNENVKNTALKAFNEIEDLLSLHESSQKRYAKTCLVAGSGNTAQRLLELPRTFEVGELTSMEAKGRISGFWQGNQRYFRVLDHPWRPELVADLMIGYAMSQGTLVEPVDRIRLKRSHQDSTKLVVETERDQYAAGIVLVCMGVGAPSQLNQFLPSESWPSTLPALSGNKFEVLHTALLLGKDDPNLLPDIFVNISEDWAAVRHKLQGSMNSILIFSESRAISALSPLENLPSLQSDDTDRLQRKIEKGGYPFHHQVQKHHCFRMEQRSPRPSKTLSSIHSVAPCTFLMPGFPQLAVGFSGKATFGLETARRMLTELGIANSHSRFLPKLPNLSYRGRLQFWSNTFDDQNL